MNYGNYRIEVYRHVVYDSINSLFTSTSLVSIALLHSPLHSIDKKHTRHEQSRHRIVTMKLSHFLPTVLLATCPYASAEEPQNETPKVEDPIPVGELWTAKWDNAALQAYTQHCRNKNTYTAETFKLSERTSYPIPTPIPLTFHHPHYTQHGNPPIHTLTYKQTRSLPNPKRPRPLPKNLLQQTTLRRLLGRPRRPRRTARPPPHAALLAPLQSALLAEEQPHAEALQRARGRGVLCAGGYLSYLAVVGG